jgi:hypothetical protein
MITAILLLQTAAAAPTVGDTIWLARTVAVPEGHTVRPPDDSLAGPVELLGPPQLVQQQGAVLIRYPAVAWEPGRHTVALPGPVLVGPDGTADSTAPLEVSVTVASVLPRVAGDTVLPVQPPTGLVPRQETSLLPLLALLGLGVLLLAPLHWWWRRRGPRVAPEPVATEPAGVPFARWADAGEPRAVLAAAAAVLRTVLSHTTPGAQPGLDTTELLAVLTERRPDLPLGEIEAVLRELDATRFAPAAFGDAADVARRAAALAARIAGDTPAAERAEPVEASA